MLNMVCALGVQTESKHSQASFMEWLFILLKIQYIIMISSDGGLSPVPSLLLRGSQDEEYHTPECVGFKSNPEDLLEHI